MKKVIKPTVFIALILFLLLGFGVARNIAMLVVGTSETSVYAYTRANMNSGTEFVRMREDIMYPGDDNRFEVYVEDKLKATFDSLEDAITFASGYQKSSIRERGKTRWLWDNYPLYSVFTNFGNEREFYEFHEAISFARNQKNVSILYRKDGGLVWSNMSPLTGNAQINAPHISQLPELPRGCEVTSLAMLLRTLDINADKMTLAQAVKKDNSPYEIVRGNIHYGNPNDGFIGDMYSFDGPGLGVYHSPIHTLLEEYLPDSALDLTGCDFEDLLYFLEQGTPVWVITNSSYAPLPDSSFITWHTSSGEIQITYKEHSVLITGYDGRMVYFNDPLGGMSRAPRREFIRAWEQMGRQAVSVTPQSVS